MSTAAPANDRSARTSVQTVEITCPAWCEVPANEHVHDLWNMDGNCIHHSLAVYIADQAGLSAPLEPLVLGDRVELNMTAQTSPDGRETAPPVVHLYGAQQMSVSQALELADAIKSLVQNYRTAGGSVD